VTLLVNIATEDELSEAVAVRLVNGAFGVGRVGNVLGRKGNSYLIKKLPSLRQMANREPVLVLTDLDDTNCASNLLQAWSGGQAFPENLLLRVAVRETEAWLLADRKGMANLLGISPNKIPVDPESLADPKRVLLHLARNAKREVRSELVVAKGAAASQGLGYNRLLSSFVSSDWQIEDAIIRSASLSKAVARLRELANRFPH
jgi:hypothetical protein